MDSRSVQAMGLRCEDRNLQCVVSNPEESGRGNAAATVFRAQLQEPPIPSDPTSSQTSEQLPTYNAYSIDGDVTAPLVYVNYGNREDYEALDRFGISVKGAIVIARYGHGWRGIKPKVAAEHGAIGCIIYSDPKGDSYYEGDTYLAADGGPRRESSAAASWTRIIRAIR